MNIVIAYIQQVFSLLTKTIRASYCISHTPAFIL